MITGAKFASQLQTMDGCLVLVVPENIESKALDALLEEVTGYVHGSGYRGVVVDLRVVDVIDASMVASIEYFIDVLRVLGYPCAVSGILPQCAAIMTEMGFSFRADMETKWFAEDAVRSLVNDRRGQDDR